MGLTEKDIVSSFKGLGIVETDTIIVHSSMKSFGYVEGGANTVIKGLMKVVENGTLCFPSLRIKNFYNAYRDWDVKTTPSDVGLLSETFRNADGVMRSDQETHSVTAYGKDAKFITEAHKTGKPRTGVFGEYSFGHNSPWQRIYDLDGKVVMIGVTMVYNTFKHFVEYCLVEDVTENIKDKKIKEQALSELSKFSDKKPAPDRDPDAKPEGVWFWNDGLKTQQEMDSLGLIKHGKCGNARLISFRVKDFYEFLYKKMRYHSDEWLNKKAHNWLKKYDKNNVYIGENYGN